MLINFHTANSASFYNYKIYVTLSLVERINSDHLSIYHYNNLSPERIQVLHKLVTDNSNIAALIVHPFHSIGADYENLYGSTIDYNTNLRSFLSQKKHLTVVMVEKNNYHSDFFQIANSTSNCLIIPTKTACPIPEYPDKSSETNWLILIKTLKEIGVKRLFVGGLFFLDTDKLEPDAGCVNLTAQIMSSHFEVLMISDILYPHHPHNYPLPSTFSKLI